MVQPPSSLRLPVRHNLEGFACEPPFQRSEIVRSKKRLKYLVFPLQPKYESLIGSDPLNYPQIKI
jgi:hypothetical protein